jgi:hypothetical protein
MSVAKKEAAINGVEFADSEWIVGHSEVETPLYGTNHQQKGA